MVAARRTNPAGTCYETSLGLKTGSGFRSWSTGGAGGSTGFSAKILARADGVKPKRLNIVPTWFILRLEALGVVARLGLPARSCRW